MGPGAPRLPCAAEVSPGSEALSCSLKDHLPARECVLTYMYISGGQAAIAYTDIVGQAGFKD